MKDIRCGTLVEQVTAFLDGGLDADARRRFVEHVAHCEGCERYLDQVRTTIHILRTLS
jgi:anti-sigma factor RsiW